MPVRQPKYTAQEAGPLAYALYEKLRPVIEPDNLGKAVALDLVSQDYEIDADFGAAATRLMQRQPNSHVVCLKIGGGALWTFGGFEPVIESKPGGAVTTRPIP